MTLPPGEQSPTTLLQFCADTWGCSALKDLLNSNFSAALFGAGVGAIGAYYFAKRARRRERLADEFEAINAAILSTSSLCSTLLVYKRDSVNPIVDRYETQHAKYLISILGAEEKARCGKATLVHVQVDGIRLPRLSLPPR